MPRVKEILCLSGGLDSFIAWHYLGKPPTIYFHTKQVHSDKEWACVNKITNGKTILDHSLCFSQELDIYIPQRNLLFASRAGAIAEKVWIAGLKDDMVEDKTENAFTVMSSCLSFTGKESVKVDSPFWDMTKTNICRWFVKSVHNGNVMKAEYELRTKSISCYSGGNDHCDRCKSCFRKACAMHNAGMFCPFINRAMIAEYEQNAIKGKYIPERNGDILRYTKWYKKTQRFVRDCSIT